VWPAAAPLDADVDVAHLARAFPLSGGNIKNVALAAAFAAASDGGGREARIALRHVLLGIQREYGKMGRELEPDELRHGLNGTRTPR
jgi:hypothetical protein